MKNSYANLNPKQKYEVEKGIKYGLRDEQVAMYAKPEFGWEQMREIREGFENGAISK